MSYSGPCDIFEGLSSPPDPDGFNGRDYVLFTSMHQCLSLRRSISRSA